MYSFQQQGEAISPEEIARLLRGIGASGRFVGFNYVVFIIYRILQNPGEYYWLTKCAYPEAAKHRFRTCQRDRRQTFARSVKLSDNRF